MARKHNSDVNVNIATLSMVALDIRETSVREVISAGTAIAYAQKTDAPFVTLIGDKAFYVCYGDETASSVNGMRVPADTYFKIYANRQRVGLNGVSTAPTITMNASTKDQMDYTAIAGVINGVAFSVGAGTGLEFTAANTINTGLAGSSLWGAWLFQVNAAGTISTKPANGLADQVWATEQEAIDALPGPDANNIAIAYLTINMASGTKFTCNTTEFDDANVTSYTFTAVTSPTAAEAIQKISTRGEGVHPGTGEWSRIGASLSIDAPANNTKIYIVESY